MPNHYPPTWFIFIKLQHMYMKIMLFYSAAIGNNPVISWWNWGQCLHLCIHMPSSIIVWHCSFDGCVLKIACESLTLMPHWLWPIYYESSLWCFSATLELTLRQTTFISLKLLPLLLPCLLFCSFRSFFSSRAFVDAFALTMTDKSSPSVLTMDNFYSFCNMFSDRIYLHFEGKEETCIIVKSMANTLYLYCYADVPPSSFQRSFYPSNQLEN